MSGFTAAHSPDAVSARAAGRLRARAPFAALVVGAALAGFLVTDPAASARAVSDAGPDLVRLLRGMAAIKALMAAAAAGGVLWRLSAPVPVPRLAAYALAVGAMAAGPGLIWSMAHVGAGALFLHGGLAATVILLWRDPAVMARLDTTILRRRGR